MSATRFQTRGKVVSRQSGRTARVVSLRRGPFGWLYVKVRWDDTGRMQEATSRELTPL
jgi:hypothetical protein